MEVGKETTDKSVTEMVEESGADEEYILLPDTETVEECGADEAYILLPDTETIEEYGTDEEYFLMPVTETVEEYGADEEYFLLFDNEMVVEPYADEQVFLLSDTERDKSETNNVHAKKKKQAEDSLNGCQENKKKRKEIHEDSVTAVSPKKLARVTGVNPRPARRRKQKSAAHRARRSPDHLTMNPQMESPSQLQFETCDVNDEETPRNAQKLIYSSKAVPVKKTSGTVNFGSEGESSGVDDDSEESAVASMFIPWMPSIVLDVEVPEDSPEPGAVAASPWPPSAQLEPTDIFKFDWRPAPVPPVAPTERREAFAETNCGPTAPFLSPYDAFVAIWDQTFMEYIASECNRYVQEIVEKQMHREGNLGHANRNRLWQDTDADELYVFFALVLATGICIKPDIKEYWLHGDIMSTPNFSQYMTAKRFYLLSKGLHFAPNSPHVASLPRSEAKIYKIDPVLKHLNSKFQSLYRLGRDIALHESLAQWNKGWPSIDQYIKNEASEGIRTCEVYECETGYLWRFKVYADCVQDSDEVRPVSGVTASHVLELLKGLEYKGHTVWINHFYNSPALARVLKSLGTDCVGTLRSGLQFVPRQLSTLTRSEMVDGQMDSCTSGDVDILSWRDRQNRATVLTTYHGATLYTGHGKTMPTAIHDYNSCMSGVRKKEQMLSKYPIEHKTSQVWYKKLFNRLLNVSVLNAHILHKRSPVPDSHERIIIANHRHFRRILVTQILKRHKIRPVLSASGATQKRVCRSVVRDVPLFTSEALQHFPAQYELLPGDKKERIRRSCVLCHKRIHTYCPACDVTLCPFDCIKTYHRK